MVNSVGDLPRSLSVIDKASEISECLFRVCLPGLRGYGAGTHVKDDTVPAWPNGLLESSDPCLGGENCRTEVDDRSIVTLNSRTSHARTESHAERSGQRGAAEIAHANMEHCKSWSVSKLRASRLHKSSRILWPPLPTGPPVADAGTVSCASRKTSF